MLVRDFSPEAHRRSSCSTADGTADLNWFRCYPPSAAYRAIAFDHRGHGTGIRSKKKFRLEDRSDDVVTSPASSASIGSSPSGTRWAGRSRTLRRRHPEVVGRRAVRDGAKFWPTRSGSGSWLTGLAAMARIRPTRRRWLTDQFFLQRKSKKWEPWAIREASHHDWRMVLEAGRAIGSFSSVGWIGAIDVPVANVITMRDTVVPLGRQTALYELIPGADVFRVDGAHDAVVANAERFVPTLLRAIDSVDRRARRD